MATIVKCPTCRRDVEWSPASQFRPFCSDRCRLIDLGAWLTEQHKIPDESAAKASGPPDSTEDLELVQPEFWHDRWRTGQIGFHQSTVDRSWRSTGRSSPCRPQAAYSCPSAARVSIFCGCAIAGTASWAVELSAIALESFCMENGIPARRRSLGDFDVYEAEGLQLIRGDFFALTPEMLGRLPLSTIAPR